MPPRPVPPCDAGGYFRQDKQLNRALYGPGVTSRDVMGGRVPRPAEFAPVYALLAQLQAAAGPAVAAYRLPGAQAVDARPWLRDRKQPRQEAPQPAGSGSGSGSGRARSAFAGSAAAGTDAGSGEEPSALPPLAWGSEPPLPAQNGGAADGAAVSDPGSPQQLAARSASPGRPPRHPRGLSPRQRGSSSTQLNNSGSAQAATPSAAAETQPATQGRSSPSGSSHSWGSKDGSPHAGVHPMPC